MLDEHKNCSSNPKEFRDAKHYDAVFNDLIQECKHNSPGARLSARLRNALERMRPDERRELVSRTRDGCAPLFVAAERGNAELVEYLVYVCGAELEQRGVYEVAHDRTAHSVTPLWCAAVAGRLEALRALADAGADIDAPSDSGSTPVRSACFMTHEHVVRFLVERGADILRPNDNGGTCLINAVQSASLCGYLLEHGAQPDAQDLQLKTALHYAIQEHRLETAHLLLESGASPHLLSHTGDDVLRLACMKGSPQAVQLLLTRVRYSPSRAADAWELLGAVQLLEFNDAGSSMASWRCATAIRHAQPSYPEKRGLEGDDGAARVSAALGVPEWRGPGELQLLAADVDAMQTQALLVLLRVLGTAHEDTLFRLMHRGATYVHGARPQRSVDLWKLALRTRLGTDCLLDNDACLGVTALTRLLLEAHAGRVAAPAHYRDVLEVYSLIADSLPESRRQLAAEGAARRQAENFDRALRCVSHLLYLLLRTARDAAERAAVHRAAHRLVRADPRCALTGDTLLHLCASRLNVVRSSYLADDGRAPPVFPHEPTVALLVRVGADARVRNAARSTPLHVATVPFNFSSELAETLLAGGAHLDQPNAFGDSAARLVALNRGSRVRPLRYASLRCLAARAVVASAQPVPPGALPAELQAFLDLHRP